tara:strand:+ start:174 stop:503 length:330 start_codon:yes stop_codon:yes gene_type:complete
MNKKNKEPQKTIREQLQESHDLIENSIAFWEIQMDEVIRKMDRTEEFPDWHPSKTEEEYNNLNVEMQFILKRLQNEEREIDTLEEKTNRLLADKIFKKFKRVDGSETQG